MPNYHSRSAHKQSLILTFIFMLMVLLVISTTWMEEHDDVTMEPAQSGQQTIGQLAVNATIDPSNNPQSPSPTKEALRQQLEHYAIAAADIRAILALPLLTERLKSPLTPQTLHIQADPQGHLQTLRYPLSADRTLTVTRVAQHLQETIEYSSPPHPVKRVSGTIKHSLYRAQHRLGLPENIIMQLAHIFSWRINFSHDIRQGDRFTVLYDTDPKPPHHARHVLAARFTLHNGKTVEAFRYQDRHGHVGYYDEKGHSLQSAFNHFPVHFTRISSRFSLHGRYHPMLHFVRPHLGVDLASPRGSHIHTVGAGRIAFAGWRGGYGRAVIVDHGHGYTTLYGHMLKFARGLHAGTRVKKGQLIGYVGRTGLATGYHCHFEVRIHGHHVNPLSAKLPMAHTLTRSQRKHFQQAILPWKMALHQMT